MNREMYDYIMNNLDRFTESAKSIKGVSLNKIKEVVDYEGITFKFTPNDSMLFPELIIINEGSAKDIGMYIVLYDTLDKKTAKSVCIFQVVYDNNELAFAKHNNSPLIVEYTKNGKNNNCDAVLKKLPDSIYDKVTDLLNVISNDMKSQNKNINFFEMAKETVKTNINNFKNYLGLGKKTEESTTSSIVPNLVEDRSETSSVQYQSNRSSETSSIVPNLVESPSETSSIAPTTLKINRFSETSSVQNAGNKFSKTSSFAFSTRKKTNSYKLVGGKNSNCVNLFALKFLE